MNISQRSCRKQTAGWIASHESVYESTGCNNQTVRSGDFMCGRQSIKWEAGLKRSDYDLTFSSALKTPAAEILRMRCHLWASQWMQTNKTRSLVWETKLCPNIHSHLDLCTNNPTNWFRQAKPSCTHKCQALTHSSFTLQSHLVSHESFVTQATNLLPLILP